jgi:hypothetical protein
VKNWFRKGFGVATCLTGAFLMFHGSILGSDTTGIAMILGIIGIGIISTSKDPEKIRNGV